MKNAVLYKEHWLMKTSKAYELFETWKSHKDPKLQRTAQKAFEDHFKEVLSKHGTV